MSMPLCITRQVLTDIEVSPHDILVKVYDSNKAVSAVDDYNTSTRSLAAATLRNFLGTRNLGEILSERSKQSFVSLSFLS